MTPSGLVLLTLLIPTAGTVFIGLLRRNPNAREAASLITAGVLFGTVLQVYRAVMSGERPGIILAEPIPGIPIALEALSLIVLARS